MDIPEEHRKKVEELIREIKCTKSPTCLERQPHQLHPVRHLNGTNLYECKEQDFSCVFALGFGDTAFCKCPVRVYLKKHCNI